MERARDSLVYEACDKDYHKGHCKGGLSRAGPQECRFRSLRPPLRQIMVVVSVQGLGAQGFRGFGV